MKFQCSDQHVTLSLQRSTLRQTCTVLSRGDVPTLCLPAHAAYRVSRTRHVRNFYVACKRTPRHPADRARHHKPTIESPPRNAFSRHEEEREPDVKSSSACLLASDKDFPTPSNSQPGSHPSIQSSC